MRAHLFTTVAALLIALPVSAQTGPSGSSTVNPGQTGPGTSGLGVGTPMPGTTTLRTMTDQPASGTAQAQPRRVVRAKPRAQASPMQASDTRVPADAADGAPPTGAYRGGAGSPLSNQASNIDGRNTRSEIAPRLPDPGASSSDPAAYLAAAKRALQQNKTGAAQEALERAETRILSRTEDPAMASQPSTAAMARSISDARRALGNRDRAGAMRAIDMAMAAPVPAIGPATTTTMVPGSPMMAPTMAPRTY